MLIEFNIANFRSIHAKQTLSMVASSDQRLIKTNCTETEIAAIPCLLNSAAIYGPNASGKSSLIAALEFMRNFVIESAVGIREGQSLNISPFRFDETALSEPTEFEVHFIENGIRYQYGFSATTTRIVHEWLFAYVGRKSQRWFERKYDEKQQKDIWYFGSYLSGGKQRQVWKKATRENALFLSTAVNLNCEQLKPMFYWFTNKLPIIYGNSPLPLAATLNYIKDETNKSIALQFLQAADLGITDIRVEMRKGMEAQFKLESGNMQMQTPREIEIPIITLFHGKVGFDLSHESHGTQRLLAYVGFFLDVLKHGKLLVIDEIEASLHSKLSRFLIEFFHNPKLNKHNAQLIFSTHDTSLLDNELFRRDQIWFMEKDKANASKLYPLTDFNPRANEALEKGYLQGRYGGLPFFGELKLDE